MDNKGNIWSSTTWRSRFRDILKVDVLPSDIHKTFQQFGLTPYVMKKRKGGSQIEGYYDSEVNDLLQRGDGLKQALIKKGVPYIPKQSKHKNYKGNYVQMKKPEVGKYQPMNIVDPEDLPKQQHNYQSQVHVEPSYRNGENDMEAYSNHLIQQYQFENINNKKIIITEEQFKKFFKEKKEH